MNTIFTIFTVLLIIQFVSAPAVFILLFFITAPYGKFTRGGWGPLIPARAAWGIMESPAVIIPVVFFLFSPEKSAVALVFLLLWLSHYIRRTIVFPLLPGRKTHPMPLLILLFSLFFQLMNSYINGVMLFGVNDHYTVQWFTGPRFIAGTALFLAGYIINAQSDMILHKLKQKGEGYQIPDGGMFSLISNPHYFGEIMEWTGWAVLTWSVPGLAFAVFTFANLAPRALKNHAWYKETFPDYPKKRKALIPFIW